MKKLAELTISPAPWSFADDGIGEYDIRCSGVSYGEDYEGDDIIAQSVQKKDAPMLAAAPDLYHVAWCFDRLCEEGRVDVKNPFVYEVWCQCRAALAKAAGEDVAK